MLPPKLTEQTLDKDTLEKRIQEVTRLLLQRCKPLKIILFGSGANQTAKPSSDLDVAIIFNTPQERNDAKKAIYSIPSIVGFPVDFLLFDREEFQKKLSVGGVCELIEREGRTLYEVC